MCMSLKLNSRANCKNILLSLASVSCAMRAYLFLIFTSRSSRARSCSVLKSTFIIYFVIFLQTSWLQFVTHNLICNTLKQVLFLSAPASLCSRRSLIPLPPSPLRRMSSALFFLLLFPCFNYFNIFANETHSVMGCVNRLRF